VQVHNILVGKLQNISVIFI